MLSFQESTLSFEAKNEQYYSQCVISTKIEFMTSLFVSEYGLL